jgi:hypothetical protein
MKTANTKALLLAVLLLAGMIVSPVFAYYVPIQIQPSDNNLNITQNRVDDFTILHYEETGRVISVVNIYQEIDSTVNFTLNYGNGETVAGYTTYTSIVPYLYSKQEMYLGGYYNSQEFVGQPGEQRYIIGYASEMSDNGTLISPGFMIQNPGFIDWNIAVFYPLDDFSSHLINSIDITSNIPIDALVLTDTAENTDRLAGFTSLNQLDTVTEWVQLASSFAGSIKDFIFSIFWILKFFFIDNLLLIIALWIAVSMAYSAISTGDIFKFYTKFFRLQKALLDFIVSLWNTLVSIVGTMVQIFVKWL